MSFGNPEGQFPKQSEESLFSESTPNQPKETVESVAETVPGMEARSLGADVEEVPMMSDAEFDALLLEAANKRPNPNSYENDASNQFYVKAMSHDLAIVPKLLKERNKQLSPASLEKLKAMREDYLSKFFVEDLGGGLQVARDVSFSEFDRTSPDYLKPNAVQKEDKYGKISTNFRPNINSEVQASIATQLEDFDIMLKKLEVKK